MLDLKNKLINAIRTELATAIKSYDLELNSEVNITDDYTIEIYFEDYVKYILSGRKPNSRFPNIKQIAIWCNKKGIPSDNSTVYLISRAIAVNGIKPRPFFDKFNAEEVVDKFFENYINELIKIIDVCMKKQ